MLKKLAEWLGALIEVGLLLKIFSLLWNMNQELARIQERIKSVGKLNEKVERLYSDYNSLKVEVDYLRWRVENAK